MVGREREEGRESMHWLLRKPKIPNRDVLPYTMNTAKTIEQGRPPKRTETDSISSISRPTTSTSSGGASPSPCDDDDNKNTCNNSEIPRIRGSTTSILVVPTQKESLSKDAYQKRHHASRNRRKERISMRNSNINSFSPKDEVEVVSEEQPLSVHYNNVVVKSYPIILGDNPGGKTSGPPISIGWEPMVSATFDLEDYESILNEQKKKKNHKKKNRKKNKDCGSSSERVPILSPRKRLQILHRSGYSVTEILASKSAAKEDREKRRKSYYDYASTEQREFWKEFQGKFSHAAVMNWCSSGSRSRQVEERNVPFPLPFSYFFKNNKSYDKMDAMKDEKLNDLPGLVFDLSNRYSP